MVNRRPTQNICLATPLVEGSQNGSGGFSQMQHEFIPNFGSEFFLPKLIA